MSWAPPKLKTIMLNGEEYVKKTDYDSSVKDLMANKPSMELCSREILMDRANVSAIGSATLKGQWIRTRISIDYLKRIIKAIESLDMDSNAVDLVWAADYPCFIGRLDTKTNTIHGFMIAPRVDNS